MKPRMNPIRALTYSALCLALCLVLPFLTGQIPQIGGCFFAASSAAPGGALP